MLRQLPSKTEMPDLIIDISQTALSSGLANELFEPEQDQLQPVRRVRQWRGVAAAGGDPDHARHQPQAQ
ncbi:hypothetical protein G6F46_015459 [Rhizopus delemar]|nr:hypothetical protein G6F46_015459 [Rhizopus delemar]